MRKVMNDELRVKKKETNNNLTYTITLKCKIERMELSKEKEKILQPAIKNVREGWEEQFKNSTSPLSNDEKVWQDSPNKFDENEWEWKN